MSQVIDKPIRSPAPAASAGIDSAPALEVRSAGLYRNGRWLFRGLNLRLSAGQLVAITGPSGVGKSSLLACLGGALKFTEGTLEPNGFKQSPRPSWVFQDLQLVPQATLLANVLMARLSRYPWWKTLWSFPLEERRAALQALDELGLAELALRPVRYTSGGEQQRTAVARALFAHSPLLLADEPVANLNETLAALVLDRLRDEARDRNAIVVCVLHHEDQVRQYADAALRLDPQAPEGAVWEQIG